MHRPFMRVAVVLALLVCALTVHGQHREGTGHRPDASNTAVASIAADSSIGAVVAMSPADVHESHDESHGDACGDPSSVHRPVASLALVLTAVAVWYAALGRDDVGRAEPPPVRQGRSLLILQCVSRT
jgi:hypothetical protein